MGTRKKAIAPRKILAGDIGGTSTRLALFRAVPPHFHRIVGKTFPSRDYQSLEEVLRDFLKEKMEIEAACFGVAGPVIDGQVTATNLPWHVDCRLLQKELSLENLTLINDLVANAYGIAVLKKADFTILNLGKVKKGNAVLLSAGTGLGQAVLFWNGRKHVPSASEGGHVEFGPRNELEIKLFHYLFNRFGHVSYERVLSEAGLRNIYEFLKNSGRFGREPRWLSHKMKQEDPAAVISKTAEEKKSPVCEKAMDMFASIYGATAGNLALRSWRSGEYISEAGSHQRLSGSLKSGHLGRPLRKRGAFLRLLPIFLSKSSSTTKRPFWEQPVEPWNCWEKDEHPTGKIDKGKDPFQY